MKKKIHLILLIAIVGFFLSSSLYLLKGNPLTSHLVENKTQIFKKFVDDYQQEGAKSVSDQIHPDLLPVLKDFDNLPITHYFLTHKPTGVKSISYHLENSSHKKIRKCLFQYDFSEKPYFVLNSKYRDMLTEEGPYSIAVSIEETEENNKAYITSIYLQPLSAQEKQLLNFSLKEKSLFQLAFLTLALLIPIFVLFTLIQFVRLPQACQKSRWFAFIAFGLIQVNLNWSTGDLTFEFLSALLLGIGVTKMGMYGSWVISLSFPMGAFLFWFKRKKWVSDYYGAG